MPRDSRTARDSSASRPPKRRLARLAWRWLALAAVLVPTPAAEPAGRVPDILIVTIDTLRTDRLSAYGYDRPTSPRLDELMAQGVRFTDAHTVEGLTGPAAASMVTSLYPHEHGASRNGLGMRPHLASLPKSLAQLGYDTVALVGNWTLRDRLTGLGEHFADYREVFSRKRWLGLFTQEATAVDLTDRALAWLGEHRANRRGRPFLAWVHYVEPHEPYRLQREFAGRLGVSTDGASRSDRYDTEVAFVDHQIGRLLDGIRTAELSSDLVVVFAADHGESLGEHDYWGHGRNVHRPGISIPLSVTWPGRIEGGQTVAAPASITDVAPTLLGLVGLPIDPAFQGYDWSAVLTGEEEPPAARIIRLQAHKGAVVNETKRSRSAGLLEVGIVRDGRKEVLDLKSGDVRLYDLAVDPHELDDLAGAGATPSAELEGWLESVRAGLELMDELPTAELDAESIERLRALGYVD